MHDENRWAEIGQLRKEVLEQQERNGQTPVELVRKIEGLQRDLDRDTGFAACQLNSHSIAVRLEDDRSVPGKLMPHDLLRVVSSATDLMKIVKEGFGNNITFQWTAFIPGSSCIAGDFDTPIETQKKESQAESLKRIKETEETIQKVVEAASILDQKRPPAEKINEFQKATGLKNEETYEVMSNLQKLRESKQTVELKAASTADLSSKTPPKSFTVSGATVNNLRKTKTALAAIMDPENTRKVEGKVVELDHHNDKDLRFGILVSAESHVYTVHYPASEDQRVRQRKGDVVKVTINRKGPNTSWFFESWSS